MNYLVIVSILVAFAVSACLTPLVIRFMLQRSAAQTEREEGVQSHLKKAGTPTMGGISIIIAILAASIPFIRRYPGILPILFLTVSFGAIGFVDDYLKVIKHRVDGLMPRQKLALQFAATLVFYLILRLMKIDLTLILPFGGGKLYSIGWFAIPLLFIVVLATVNGVNFTDGLDGLASSVTLIVAVFFVIASLIRSAGISPIAGAVIGALFGFLIFNAYPAKIFMGDTGSLALGGFVAGAAYVMHMPIFILLIGFIYAFELVSVVMQVSYFKATGGKRIFRMTPIHHHFELCGWSETRIVTVFTVITVMLCLICLVRI